MSNSLVSVIIPCYNAEQYVSNCIESVLNQTHSSTEVIVIDDGSTDESWSRIQEYSNSVCAVQQENHGACHARNRGASMASGDAFLFLDADDQLAPSTLEILVDTLHKAEAGIVACPWKSLRWDGQQWRIEPHSYDQFPPSGDYIRDWIAGGWFIPPCCLLWERRSYEQTGGWDECLHANQDGDLALRALIQGIEIQQTKKGLSLHRDTSTAGEMSISQQKTTDTIRSRIRVLTKVIDRLQRQNRLNEYASVIAHRLHNLSKQGYRLSGALPPSFLERLKEASRMAWKLAGTEALSGSALHQFLCATLGLHRKEKIASALAQIGIARKKRRDALTSSSERTVAHESSA